jgi:hypothetical protein
VSVCYKKKSVYSVQERAIVMLKKECFFCAKECLLYKRKSVFCKTECLLYKRKSACPYNESICSVQVSVFCSARVKG